MPALLIRIEGWPSNAWIVAAANTYAKASVQMMIVWKVCSKASCHVLQWDKEPIIPKL